MASFSRISRMFSSYKVHFMVLWLLLLSMMLDCGELYRTFLYLNFLLVMVYLVSNWRLLERDQRSPILAVLAIPLALSVLHMLAIGKVDLSKDIRHLWLAAFVTLGVWVFARRYASQASQKFGFISAGWWLIISYVVIEAIYFFLKSKPFGTTRNPHYLALYASLLLPVAFMLFRKVGCVQRIVLTPAIALLFYFVLGSSSRPAWLALMISMFVMLPLVRPLYRKLALVILVAVPALLFVANIANFGDRLSDLGRNLTREERVIIWQDTLQMQQQSEPLQWLWGHGIDSFREDFKQFSRFHGQLDFNSPHNSFLDMLYTTGLLGLSLLMAVYYWLYRSFMHIASVSTEYREVSYLMLTLLAFNLLFIMITMPTLSHYSTYTLAILGGIQLYLRQGLSNIS